MLRTEDETIDGHTYRVTMLPVSKGRRLLAELFKVAGPALGDLASAAAGAKGVSEVKVESLAGALRQLADRLEPAFLDRLCEELAASTQLVLDGGARAVPLKQEMEFHFAGRYGAMFKWIAFALKVNYADFFGAWSGGVRALQQKAQAPGA
jgi:hypothetical protein